MLPGLVLALLVLSQSQTPAHRRTGRGPLRAHTLDLGTGTLTRGPRVHDRTAATVVDFDNNDLGGFLGVDSGNGFCEWFDSATKGFAGNRSDLMSEIVFAYCSAKLTPGSGGPGGSVRLGFYEGYSWGGGAPTTVAAVFTLTGLPANTSSSSFFAGFDCFFIQVEFADLIAFADGPIGYSWRFLDVGTTGVLAGTWPFLACTTSCSAIAPPALDVMDRYCPPGTLVSSFTFGSTSGSFTSMSMEIREAADLAATLTPYNATPAPNSDQLAATVATVGNDWTLFLARVPSSVPGNFVVSVRTNRVAVPGGLPVPPPVQGRLLVSGAPLGQLGGTHDGTRGTLTVPIPPKLDLLCLHFAAQAVVFGGSIELSSALEGTTGTF